MGRISYDPIKDRFAEFIRDSPVLRRVFYFLLDIFFLRSWHIRRLLRREGDILEKKGEWTLLDAGCGFGQYDRFILSRFKNVHLTSIDVKESYLQSCRKYFAEEIKSGRSVFETADLMNFERKGQFDLIICIDVLEHIEDDLTVIENLSRSLKPGGKLLMHSPSHYSEEDSAGEEESFVGEHARAGYSKKDITKKYRLAGLSINRAHYTYGWFGHLSWILTVKYPMLFINRIGMVALLPLAFYYTVVLPVCLLMNLADLYTENKKGNGIVALGSRVRNSSRSSARDSTLSSGNGWMQSGRLSDG